MGVRQVPIQADGADRRIYLRAFNTSDGSVRTDLAYNTAGLTAQYVREGATATTITLATQTAAGAHSDGGFIHVANGEYRLDLPDAATASGVKRVSVILTHTGTLFETGDIFITSYDPNAAGADAPSIADAVWDEARSGHVASGSFGEYVKADATLISGDSTAADNLEFMLDGTGGVTISAVLGANAVTATSIASNAITSAKIATDAIGAAQIADNAIDAGAIAADAITAATIATGAIDADALATDAVDEIAAGIWNIADAEEAAVPAANATFRDKLNFMFAVVRNKTTFNKTTGVWTLKADDGTTSVAARTDTDDGTTYTKGEVA